jgi:hypothetical protein
MSKIRALQIVLGGGLTALGLLLAVGAPLPALAGTSTANTTANVAVGSTITLSGLTSSFTLTGNSQTTAAQLSAVTMNVKTNNITGYTVAVQSASATLAGATSGNTDTIPIAALSTRETGTLPYSVLSNSAAVTVHSQATRSAAAGDTVNNDYSVAIPFVNSDTYSTTLNYTAATQ